MPDRSRSQRTIRLPAAALLGWLAMWPGSHASERVGLEIHVEKGRPALTLTPSSDAGTIFLFAAPKAPDLADAPSVLLTWQSPATNLTAIDAPSVIHGSAAAFFRAMLLPAPCPVLNPIPAGTFLMGSPESEIGHTAVEGPPTTVTLSRTVYLARTEVTQEEYLAVMGRNPSYFAGITSRPVERVSWDDATEYCRRLTATQRASGAIPSQWTYRLPTEAEWECACRADSSAAFGSQTNSAAGAELRSGGSNFDGRYEYLSGTGETYNPLGTVNWRTVPVGGYSSNAWGFQDMQGNVWEWCSDPWSARHPGGAVTDPTNPTSGADRVVRGGSWYNSATHCRASYRTHLPQGYQGNDVGFRVVLAPSGP